MAELLQRVHGSLVQVAGVGLLIRGRSGIGKSECALELVMRGHRFVADDVVQIECVDGRLRGSAPELVRHYLELRGIGIVHVPSLFGEASVLESTDIELLVNLQAWETAEVERTGLDRKTEELCGQPRSSVTLPVAPGRNVASLIEVAARNHRLREAGGDGAEQLHARVRRALRGERP